jgi:hypothetical protein
MRSAPWSLVLAIVIMCIVIAACGGSAAPRSTAPALGTNDPAAPKASPSGNPYSDYGY